MSSAPARARRQVVLDAEVDLDLANYTTTPYSLDLNANASVPPPGASPPQPVLHTLLFQAEKEPFSGDA